ncbi:MAG: aminotransferase class V-fold PLP-dependent enzyme [Pseudomonadota bacterium]
MPLDLASHFSRFRGADPDRLHFAAHSHHYWPDVTFGAQQQAWQDAARHADRKWAPLFETVVPSVKNHLARLLCLSDPSSLVFASNTHELLVRLLSCLPTDRPPRILTSDGEFHSFTRQTKRLAEENLIELRELPVDSIVDLEDRLADAVKGFGPDMVYLSHVFFNSGRALPSLSAIVNAVPSKEAFLVIDGYHAFMARPVDLAPVEDRLFYIAGGYKYTMAGEGACFMHCPPGYGPRPRNTGWYAAFGSLDQAQSGVPYAKDGWRFMGATFDPTALYRLNAVLGWLAEQGLTPGDIHRHATELQELFMAGLSALNHPVLAADRLVVPLTDQNRGNFLTFESEDAAATQDRLGEANIITDVRGTRLRVGFGIYQTKDDVDRLLNRLSGLPT